MAENSAIEWYTVGSLSDRIGAPARSIQFWAAAGVIKADDDTKHAGTGRHQRFSVGEAAIAGAVATMYRMRLPVGELKAIAAYLREQAGQWRRFLIIQYRDDKEAAIGVTMADEPAFPDGCMGAKIIALKPAGRLLDGLSHDAIPHLNSGE